jgi:pimeloyl-ACP methyl ester carboxylesterase
MSSDDGVQPLRAGFPEAELTELRRRVNATRWPERETVADDSQGVRLAMIQELARYWGSGYDWRKCEARLTGTGISAARLYWENKAQFFDAKPIMIPYAISVFPDELYQAPRSWAERAYPHNLIYYNELDRGGHFAAWEQPDLFAAEMRASFKSLR